MSRTKVIERVREPEPGRWLVIQEDHEEWESQYGYHWRHVRTWVGMLASSVDDSRLSIIANRCLRGVLDERRAEDQASHMRQVRAAERQSVASMLARRTLANPDDPFAAMRGLA
ncbi:hypothetical protein E4T66_20445 [Sinimarinibacterium sp. CAU 1509]|uniref:hypothetical protein n=1 Tax=Sinimarinibacterium sp. CAU 1509 TaxID=2562283 RepID=UPI0010AD59A5|nr:hypothetical protein [Sinimarinibacterium sp. CAU 1509]TJY55753.1 hypothetical protein E4T66_20445 [Sinimarinibacterium sp. CAU 1509]